KKKAFDQAIKQGQDLLAAKKYDDAIKAFQLAGTYLPGDPTAAALLKQAEKARNDAGNPAQTQAEFNRLMKEGNSAYVAKKYADAVKYYGEASKLMPNDQQAQKSLKAAMDQLDKAPPGPTPAQSAEYNKQMAAGAGFDEQKKCDDAR